MALSLHQSRILLVCLLAVVAIALAGCAESPAPPPPAPPPPPPPFVPQDVVVPLGDHGGSVTLTTTQSGGYTKDGQSFASGTTVEGENGYMYELTLSGGAWSAEYQPPSPSALALGRSGDARLLIRQEDGSFKVIRQEDGSTVDEQEIQSGGIIEALNGNSYRLTLEDGVLKFDFVPPDPTEIKLGGSEVGVILTVLEDGTYELNGVPFASGDTWSASNGSMYRLTLMDGEWESSYVPPEPSSVTLGTSGLVASITRREDGIYEVDGDSLLSDGIFMAGNGNTYHLVLADGVWSARFVPPDPIAVRLGTSGTVIDITQQEDGTYRALNMSFESGGILPAANGSQYRVTLVGGQWSAVFVPATPSRVILGTSGETVDLAMREDGGYELGGESIISGYIYPARNGNMYRLTLVNGAWRADFVPSEVDVDLGTSGSIVTLRREEDGRFWLGRTVFESGSTRTASNGSVYRLNLRNGLWTAIFVPDVVQVPAGDSGSFLVLVRLQDGTYSFGGMPVQSGETVTQDGNEYVLARDGDDWTATFKAGTVTVPLGTGGGTVTLVKQEDGTYTRNGRVFRSGQTVYFAGVPYRLTLGEDGWTATRRPILPPTGGTGGTDGTDGTGDTGSSKPTRTDSVRLEFGDDVGFREASDTSSDTSAPAEGTILVVGDLNLANGLSNDDGFEASVYDLLGRGLVSKNRTYVERAREVIEEIVQKMTTYLPLYELDAVNPDEHIRTGLPGEIALWTQAQNALKRVFGEDSTPLGFSPWRGTVGFSEVDDVIRELERVADALSSLSEFETEFSGLFGTNVAKDYFEAPLFRFKFGSTSGTRFGIFASRKDALGGGALGSGWNSGAFAYSPLEQPAASALSTQGQATFRGDTVALEPTETEEPKMYSGKIELTVTFSTDDVTAVVQDLDDDEGVAWTYLSEDNEVEFLQLPNAAMTDVGRFASTGDAMVRYATGGGSDTPIIGANELTGQLVNAGSEVLGTWKVGTSNSMLLEGAFGAGRSSVASLPWLSISDRGATSKTSVGTTVPDGNADLVLGTKTFDATQLYGSRGGSSPGELFVRTARTDLQTQRTELIGLDSNSPQNARTTIWTEAGEALRKVFPSTPANFGASFPVLLGSDSDSTADAKARRLLDEAISALGSESRFKSALATDKILDGATTEDQVAGIFKAADDSVTVQFDYTNRNYTRFGAWARSTRNHALEGPVRTHGVFAYSPVDQTNFSGALLSFSAEYKGSSVAVNRSDGSLYKGSFEMFVEWDASATNNAVTSYVRNLRNVSGDRSLFQHEDQGQLKSVSAIIFEDVTVNSTGLLALNGSNPTVNLHYENDPSQNDVSGTDSMTGKFVGTSYDGPLGVIGNWSIGDIDLEGAFGAELVP